MNEIIIVGGGKHAKVIAGILKKMQSYRIAGYTDIQDYGNLLGVPYLGTDDWLIDRLDKRRDSNLVIGLGTVTVDSARKRVINRFENHDTNFPVIVSPDSVVNEGTEIKKGTVIFDGAVINPYSTIGEWVIVNTNVTVEHDCMIGAHVHIMPGAIICGGVIIGSDTLIGAGAIVKHNVSICKRSFVGAGAVVVSNIDESGIYVGCPAKLMKPL